MYLVGTKLLLTNHGVIYVGQHEAEKDAYQIFKKVIYFIYTQELLTLTPEITLHISLQQNLVLEIEIVQL